eukprot:10326797-Prorocentrum_lima.AAC.1
MTSSLVGSEMCIRDRPRRTPCRHRSLRQPHGRSPVATHETLCGPGAVSYTHLTLPTICSV